MSENSIYKYWGKARKREDGSHDYHLLVYHCLDVAAVVQEVLVNDDFLLHKFQKQLCFFEQKSVMKFMVFLALLHDIGKFADTFQCLIPGMYKFLQGKDKEWKHGYSIRHDALGMLLWKKQVQSEFSELLSKTSVLNQEELESWVDYINKVSGFSFGHHGKPVSFSSLRNTILKEEFSDASIQAVSDFINWTFRNFFPYEILSNDIKPLNESINIASWSGAGLMVLADWIGSNSHFFPMRGLNYATIEEYWDKDAKIHATKAVKSLGILPVNIKTQNASMLFPNFSSFTPLQQKVLDIPIANGPQLFIIEDVMGAGKTEAALMLSYRLMQNGLSDGLYFALPTMATANSMYDRMKECYQDFFDNSTEASLILAHGKRQLMKSFLETIDLLNSSNEIDSYKSDEKAASAYCASWFADSRKRSLLAQMGVGTVDQALLSVLPNKHQALRLLGIGRKVLIIDEVHDYEPYTDTVLQILIEFQAALGGCMILLSATLSENKRYSMLKAFQKGIGYSLRKSELAIDSSLSDYPLILHAHSDFSANSYPVASRKELKRKVGVRWFHDCESVEDFLVKTSISGKCSCWIRNTVADAIEAWQRLSAKLGEKSVFLFHAKYTVGDRANREIKTIRNFGKDSGEKNRKGKILIATQVVEQSLDIDFDEMITDLAPVDYIIQRAGRLHRHQRSLQGNILRQGKKDQRSGVVIGIFAPEYKENPNGNWYTDLFPRGAYVYAHHGRLWLTMKALIKNQGWIQPGDESNGLRFLIESVYGKNAKWPEELNEKAFKEEGKEFAEISWAKSNTLVLNNGYSGQIGTIWEDGDSKTRLGDPTVTLCLLRWNGKDFEFWNKEETLMYEMSQLSERATKISGAINPSDPELQAKYESFMNRKKRRNDEIIWIPMLEEQNDPMTYSANIQDSRGIQQKLMYSRRFGLSFGKDSVQ